MRSPAFGAFEENQLLNRLFGEYRLDYVDGPGQGSKNRAPVELPGSSTNRLWYVTYRMWIPDPGCALNEIEGRRAFDSGTEIPIECLGYVEDRDAVYKTSVIPKRNISESMDVQFSVNLNQIIELNEREQSLLLSVAGTHGPSFKILLILVRAGPRTVLVHGSLISCVALQLA